MKILIVANGYPDKREPQWGCFERDQALALKTLGHEVSILYVDRRFRTYWRKIGFSIIKNKEINVYGLFLMPMRWAYFIPDKLHCRMVGKMFDSVYKIYAKENGKPDLIYAHFLFNIYYASILKDKYNIPLVGIEHWSGLMKQSLTSLEKYQGEIAYSKADVLLAVSKSLQARIKKLFEKESTVVYDMLGQEFVSSNVLKRDHDDGFTFVAVGSLIHRKGFDILISAFAKSNLASKGCRVIIVGDGPEKNRIIKLANEFGISDFVSLAGRKNKEEIISIMSESHVFVLSSRAETFGVVCIEALSQGLPNIATVCGGPEEFINDKNGLLIPTDDIGAMAEAMCKMYENYSQYDKPAIANECLSKFSPQVIAGQLTEIFKEITK